MRSSARQSPDLVTVQTNRAPTKFMAAGFYDYRSSAQEARDPFTQPAISGVPNASYKAFGAQVGGPIIKDKLFFFGDYQGVRQLNGITNLLTIPTDGGSQNVQSSDKAGASYTRLLQLEPIYCSNFFWLRFDL